MECDGIIENRKVMFAIITYRYWKILTKSPPHTLSFPAFRGFTIISPHQKKQLENRISLLNKKVKEKHCSTTIEILFWDKLKLYFHSVVSKYFSNIRTILSDSTFKTAYSYKM